MKRYRRGIRKLEKREARLRRRDGMLSRLRFACALFTVGLPYLLVHFEFVEMATPPILLSSLPGILLFLVFFFYQQRIRELLRLTRGQRESYRRSLLRQSEEWSEESPGPASPEATWEHPWARDLDLYGPYSLHHFLNLTSTPPGEEALSLLLSGQPDEIALDEAKWKERQEAIRELSRHRIFRVRFRREGEKLREEEPEAFHAELYAEIRPPRSLLWPLHLWGGRVLPLLTLLLAFLHFLQLIPPYFYLVLMVQGGLFFLSQAWIGNRTAPHAKLADRLARFERLFHAVSRTSFRNPLLSGMTLFKEEPHRKISRLVTITGYLAMRNNPILHFLAGIFLLYDTHLFHALLRWSDENGRQVERWFRDLGMLDALLALGEYAMDHPRHTWPSLRSEGEPSLLCEEMGHPLIPEGKRIPNTFSFGGSDRLWVITGSNMSGKSTFLRTVAVNLILAMVGSPVPARSFRFRPLRIVTSMRHKDDTRRAVSLFYSEVERIRTVLEEARKGEPSLFYIIDEMLRGTNSRERLIASRSILSMLLEEDTVGMVATHDQELTKMCGDGNGAVRCLHFEEIITEGKMDFDYLLKEGPVRSSNALRILRQEGIPVEAPEEGQV